MVRTSENTVTFRRPFVLPGLDEAQPAGVYAVETDEERLDGISFAAYRRIRVLIHLHARPGRPGVSQVAVIDPNELDAAVERDNAPTTGPADTAADPKVPERTREPRSEESNQLAIECAENEGMAVRGA